MHRAHQGTRHLLPPITSDPDETVVAEKAFAGSFAQAQALTVPVIAPAAHPGVDLPPAAEDADWEPSKMPIISPASSTVSHGAQAFGGDAGWPHFIPAMVADSFAPPKLPAIADRDPASALAHLQEGQEGQSDLASDDAHRPESESDDAHSSESQSDDAHRPNDTEGALSEFDDVDSINVTQVAAVDQDASIIVNGYMGDVVARLHIDQDLMMDQGADVSFTIDGDGHFDVLLDQEMHIDQDLQIDLDMFDVDGVLYVDLFLHDSVEVEQDTSVDARISDGPPGGTVEVNQNIEMNQDVNIDVDIEDELEKRYLVNVDVVVRQEVDADQDAVVDIKDLNGEIDLDLDATQTAAVDQHTFVEADFALI